MIEIKNKSKCSGCHACMNVCPKHCITMQVDEEGFWYPVVDKEKCIECGLCEKRCPILNDMCIDNSPKAFACFNKDEEVRKESSSGGIFTLLASQVIDLGGVVYGAAFNENFEVEHIQVTKKSELHKLRGSKYVQSRLGNSYSEIKELLSQNRLVYFSGTPCQIDGLLCFLNKKYDNLICQDIICHGVPSPKVWDKYKQEMCKEKPETIEFRNKDNGWINFNMAIRFKNNKYVKSHKEDSFMKAFLTDLCLRPSCYDCHSKSIHRNSDITLADFWGIKNVCPEMYDNKGVSLVFINSNKGEQLFNDILSNINYKEVDIKKASEWNPAAYKSVVYPKKRDDFMKNIFNAKNFNHCVEKYTRPSLIIRIKIFLRKLIG